MLSNADVEVKSATPETLQSILDSLPVSDIPTVKNGDDTIQANLNGDQNVTIYSSPYYLDQSHSKLNVDGLSACCKSPG